MGLVRAGAGDMEWGDRMVDREKVIDGLQESAAYFRSSFDAMYGTVACKKFRSWVDAIEHALALLKEQEPVVRCKDCKYWYAEIGASTGWLPCQEIVTDRNWYCASGKRRDGDA